MKLFDLMNDELLFLQQELEANVPVDREGSAMGDPCQHCHSVCASGCGANCSGGCGGGGGFQMTR